MNALYLLTLLITPFLCTQARAVPPVPPQMAKRQDSNQAGAIASTDNDPLISMGGNLVVPSMTVPPGGDPSLLYTGQAFIGLDDATFDSPLAVGIQCSAGASTGCIALYEYSPKYQTGVWTDFTLSVDDVLIFSITVVNNKTVTLSIINYTTDQEVSQTLTSSTATPPYSEALWIVDTAFDNPYYIDIGTVMWSETAAMTASGKTITPDLSTEILDLTSGGVPLSTVQISGPEITITYV